jgi:hypothetical protein
MNGTSENPKPQSRIDSSLFFRYNPCPTFHVFPVKSCSTHSTINKEKVRPQKIRAAVLAAGGAGSAMRTAIPRTAGFENPSEQTPFSLSLAGAMLTGFFLSELRHFY